MDQIPSFLELDQGSPYIDDGGVFDDQALRIGEVKEIIQPSDPRSISKKFREYTVFVQRRANGTYTNMTYENCLLANRFGTSGDRTKYTLRVDPQYKAGDDSSFTSPGLGARVLIACINGDMHNAIIIGGISNPVDGSEEGELERGHYYEFEFNGVRLAIEKDGSLKLGVQGPTDTSGKVLEEIGVVVSVSSAGVVTLSNPQASIEIGDKITLRTKQSLVEISDQAVNIGSGTGTEPVFRGRTKRGAETAIATAWGLFMAALTAYAATIQPIADPSGSATSALVAATSAMTAAIQAFEVSSEASLTLKTKAC